MRYAQFTAAFLVCLFAGISEPDNVFADQVALDVRLVNPTMKSDQKQINYLRIALTGFALDPAKDRPPVNVALVLDHSGSMAGEKLERAKEAAMAAIDRLSDTDIVSVVLYDSNVSVLVPATKATDRNAIKSAISGVTAGSSTALFAGVSKGAAEVRKFLDKNQVNRVILLSDGLANVGPQSPQELEGLGRSLMKEGISVSTLGLGLGYNEDLMVALASVGGGNHAFIESANELVSIFNQEFDGLLSVVANDFEIQIQLDSSVRPVKLVGTDGEIEGQRVRIPLAQLYSKQERYFILEAEVAAGEANSTRAMAEVTVRYRNLKTETQDKLSSSVQVRFSESEAVVAESKDLETYAYCTLQVANEQNRKATALRDAGQVQEAKKLLEENAKTLKEVRLTCEANGVTIVLPELDQLEMTNNIQATGIENEKDWGLTRKKMRAVQNSLEQQQTYGRAGDDSSLSTPQTSSSNRKQK